MNVDEILYHAAWLEARLEFDEAWKLLSSGLKHWPEEPRLWVQRAEVLKQAGAIPDALENLEAALELYSESDDPLAHARTHSRLILLRWSMAGHLSEITAELRYYNSVHAPAAARKIPLQQPDPARTLRIGYLSPDFRLCSAAMLLEMLFLHHPHTDFQIFAYSLVNQPDDIGQQQFRRLLPHWRDVSQLGIQGICEQIQADQIDILVDLAGHTSLNALPVMIQQPAPIQITGLTFNGPLGLAQIPWRLTDPLATPEPLLDEIPLYCDSWIWWPEPDWRPGRDPDNIPTVAQKLGCAHHPGRISEQTLHVWSQILEALPAASLHLKHPSYANTWCREYLQRRFWNHGISYQRLNFEGGSDYAGYLDWYQGLDLALDPFPYHGGLVSCEALWMGVPLVTLAGWMRGGESLLRQLGWQIGIGISENSYVKQAILLATSPALRREAALKLRQNLQGSSIMRGDRLARQLTGHARDLWEKACAGKL